MLHPAKSFAKRWTWLKSRIAELTRPPAPDILPQYVLTRNQPLHNPVAIAHSDALMRNIQARFPIVSVFAPQNLRPSVQLAPSCLRAPTSSTRGLRPHTSSQFRTIATNPSSFGHQTAQAASRCLTQNQYPAFARNFSTAKAPTLFQPVNAQATIFANLSTKPFSAINQKSGCLLTQNPTAPEPVSLKVGRYDADEPSRRSNSKPKTQGLNLVSAEQATMGLYAACSEPAGHKCSHDAAHDASKCAKRARLVRRGSKHVSFDRSSSSALVCGTDLGSAESLDGKDNARPRLVDGATTDARKRKPPDRSRKEVYITLRLDAALLWDLSEIDDGTSSLLFPPSPFTSLTPPRQSNGHTHLTSSLLTALTDFADLHRRHLSSVLALLQTLLQHGSYPIEINEINGMHIRVCLNHLSSEEAAREWLSSIGVDSRARYFGIEVIDASEADWDNLEDTINVPSNNNQGPSAVLVTAALNSLPSHQTAPSPAMSDFTLIASSLESSAVLIQPTVAELGPEYFRGIHEFLDAVNDMIQTGPAFTPLSKSDMSDSLSRLSLGKN